MKYIGIGKLVFCLFLIWIFQGCGRGNEETPSPKAQDTGTLQTTALIDDRYPKAAAGEPGWEYVLSASADLDGDGETERIVLTANVSLYKGIPAWNDGQAWQAYVMESGGERIDLYRQYIQLGKVSLALSEGADGDSPAVLLAENTDTHIRVIEIRYHGPGEVTATEVLSRHLIAAPDPMPPPEVRQPVEHDPLSGEA